MCEFLVPSVDMFLYSRCQSQTWYHRRFLCFAKDGLTLQVGKDRQRWELVWAEYPTNSSLAPENEWLEDEFILAWPFFRGYGLFQAVYWIVIDIWEDFCLHDFW